LRQAGWEVLQPEATMFAWAQIPTQFRPMGSLAFSKLLLERANVAVSPGIGFGEYGEGFVRIALVENRQRLRQATRNIKLGLPGTETGTREEPERRAGTGTRRGRWTPGGRAESTEYEDLTMRECEGHSAGSRGRTNRT
jgi:alanine-synthesizing transaminase